MNENKHVPIIFTNLKNSSVNSYGYIVGIFQIITILSEWVNKERKQQQTICQRSTND